MAGDTNRCKVCGVRSMVQGVKPKTAAVFLTLNLIP